MQITKPTAAILQGCEKFEEKIDLFNLLLIRKRVELEVEKSGKFEAQQVQQQQKGSWFGWWGSKDTASQDNGKDNDICMN